RKSTPKRALTQDEKIERLERKVASLRGILVSSKTAQDALNFRAALCEYRRAVLRGDEWLDGKTQFDFAPIESSEIPAGMKEYAHVC
ncbi:hypothetical protein, partial [Streptomyces scabiei]|uniref:hypothetical protein n=1 Tax=Streptomyces scabiei TaxID=1930 RepID=UPI0038F720FA